MRSMNSVVAMTFCLALASCASGPQQLYYGPAMSDSETALISVPRAPNDRTAARTRILSADDARGEPVRVTSRRIRVMPRGVCIEARATSSTMDSMVSELCFNAYAGSHYEVRASVSGASRGTPTAVPDIGALPGLQNLQSGPFSISRLFVIDLATTTVVASASPL